MAIQHETPAAYAALRAAVHHSRPQVRMWAILYMVRACLEAQRTLPPEVVTDLLEIAVHDNTFEPRFQARAALRRMQQPVPCDYPDGVYAFKVKYTYARNMHRTIELQSTQTLDTLHFAIQESIRWGADHPYSFFMNGRRYDPHYSFACPEQEDQPPWTCEAVIGELGLSPKHKFMYLFDYGDKHEFEIQVVGIRPQAEPGEYPRVVDSQGEAPEQYPRWD